ncbi:phosphatase PAP2 family protein [Nocardioides guangzhouensis]|uniref:phosphatase PAP2 family protein n=1 Tax=Nocardioides guangzhouensis TaxID=2497878 RepID=UPI001FE7EE0D|nr:phosphatase PAP2 family protein [Nocardioides guangzhouensis]
MASGSAVVWSGTQEDWFRGVNGVARATPWLHTPARLYAGYGVAVFAAVLLLSWWLARRDGDPGRMTAALWAPVGALVALGVNQVLVATVAEPRPYTSMPDALVLVARSTDPSFPSDHAVMAGAVAAGVFLVDRRLGAATVFLAVLMAVTRVYVGAHYPLDVATGLVVGAVVALASYGLARPVVSWLVTALSLTPVRPLLTARAPGIAP